MCSQSLFFSVYLLPSLILSRCTLDSYSLVWCPHSFISFDRNCERLSVLEAGRLPYQQLVQYYFLDARVEGRFELDWSSLVTEGDAKQRQERDTFQPLLGQLQWRGRNLYKGNYPAQKAYNRWAVRKASCNWRSKRLDQWAIKDCKTTHPNPPNQSVLRSGRSLRKPDRLRCFLH